MILVIILDEGAWESIHAKHPLTCLIHCLLFEQRGQIKSDCRSKRRSQAKHAQFYDIKSDELLLWPVSMIGAPTVY